VFLSRALPADTTPEVVGILADQGPLVLSEGNSSPALRRLLEDLALSDVVAVPLIAGDTFLGVATAGWEQGQPLGTLDDDVLARLRGVGDQAATALERARLLETVQHQASHDPLTGLPNRALFSSRLSEHIASAGPDAPLAVLFCDLDRFKEVNDTFGHAVGDELLRQVADRLRAAVRPEDTVSRLSGDEFALVLPDVADRADADRLAGRVACCFDQPFRLGDQQVTVRASVGVAVHTAPTTDDGGEELLRTADEAMYRVKERRRDLVGGRRR
jgi:diguanylate cyclase (GGDEF)-like protein